MKKILNLFLMAIAIFTLASCFENGGSTTSFEIDGYPKTTYVLGETFDWTGFSVKINNGTPMDKKEAESKDVKFPELIDTSKAGTFTVKVTYNGLNASFQYTVLDSYFANGNGTATAPYQVSTVEQFYAALKGSEKGEMTYYTLVNDIDFEKKLNNLTNEKNVTKKVEINGQGYALRNVNGVLGYRLENSTIKNIDIHFSEDENGEFSYLSKGAIFERSKGDVVFENINTFGKIAFCTSNASIFGQIAPETVDEENITVLRNCNNYASFTNFGSYGAVFTAGIYHLPGTQKVSANSCWYILNCKNYGEYIGTYVGLTNPNSTYLDEYTYAYYVVDENTKNFGKLISLSQSDDQIYGGTPAEKAKVKMSLLCGICNVTMEKIFKHYYVFDAAKGVIPANEFKDGSSLRQFNNEDYKNMAVVDIEGNTKLSYKFTIVEENKQLKFSVTANGEASVDKIAKYVISFAGMSTRHDSEGHPGISSTNSTFATIEVNSLEDINKLGLPTFVKDTAGYPVKNVLPTGWTDEIMYPGNKVGTIQNNGNKYSTIDSIEGLLKVSDNLYFTTDEYVVVPTAGNNWSTAAKLRYITIVALDSDGSLLGSTTFEAMK